MTKIANRASRKMDRQIKARDALKRGLETDVRYQGLAGALKHNAHSRMEAQRQIDVLDKRINAAKPLRAKKNLRGPNGQRHPNCSDARWAVHGSSGKLGR